MNEHGTLSTGNEQLMVFYEVREGTPVTPGELRRLLIDRLPQFMVPSRFARLDALPLLPNGKVDRRALAARQDDPIAPPASPSIPAATPGAAESAADDEAARLLAVWRDVLGQSVGAQDDFFEAGGDSLVGMRLISRAAKAGFKVTRTEFFRAPTVSGMLAAARAHTAASLAPRLSTASGFRPVPLTPIQHWFFEQEFAGADRWNQARFFEIAADLDHRRLEAALNAIVEHHEALRLTFVRKAGGWQQHVAPLAAPVSIPRVEVRDGDQHAREAAVEREATAVEESMRLDSGLLLRALRLSFPGEPDASDLLYLAGHHLCLDVVSWDILLESLETACQQLESGQPITPGAATPVSEWSSALYAYAQGPELRRERSWWSRACRALTPPLPRDLREGRPNDEASAEVVVTRLASGKTRRLLDHADRGSLSEYILTGLVHSLAAWSGCSTFRVGIEGHGRTDLLPGVDVSRTVGWFTTYWPVVFELVKDDSLAAVLRRVREQLRAVPGEGMGYGALRYLTADDGVTRELSSVPEPEVVFNYLGGQRPTQAGLRFRPRAGSFRASRDPRARRPSLLEISAMVVDEELELACLYSRNIHHRETIQQLMRGVGEILATLADTRPAQGHRLTSASDFPDAGLSEDELNSLIDPT
jgi:non-ribosomal peptide synthase protein (TIGR01720 family)